ncbi:MAG: metallophosphoesterase family protein [Asticcacaulis sp.]
MKIAHISDLHFGCIAPEALAGLKACLDTEQPDLVIASGDLTQSATRQEFAQARDFLAGLGRPWLAVPGNHDLPGMDAERFVRPFGRYRHYIAEDLNPLLRTPLADIKGLNSARMAVAHWNWANGSVSHSQCRDLAQTFETSEAPWRICVVHHPPFNSSQFPLAVTLFNRARFLETLKAARVDLVLAGHQHHGFTEPSVGGGHTTLFVNASTTTSQRLRRQPQGLNLLNLTPDHVRIDRMEWNGESFVTAEAVTRAKPAK